MLRKRGVKRGRRCDTWLKAIALTMTGMTLMLSSAIAIQLNLAYQQAPQPQAILVLEGNPDRVPFAATFSQLHPTLPIWVSGNRRRQVINQLQLQQAGVPSLQIFFDFCALDTVTNFTCNIKAFTLRHFHHIYLVTSDYHMRRSLAIATLVFGSQGIAVAPVVVPSNRPEPEALWRVVRDCLRSLIWLATGWTGAELGQQLEHYDFSSSQGNQGEGNKRVRSRTLRFTDRMI